MATPAPVQLQLPLTVSGLVFLCICLWHLPTFVNGLCGDMYQLKEKFTGIFNIQNSVLFSKPLHVQRRVPHMSTTCILRLQMTRLPHTSSWCLCWHYNELPLQKSVLVEVKGPFPCTNSCLLRVKSWIMGDNLQTLFHWRLRSFMYSICAEISYCKNTTQM